MGVATYREHLAATRREIREVTAAEAEQLLAAETRPALVDVRERDEYEQGYIPGAVLIPRGNLESRIENTVSDRNAPVILYCAAGNRSAFAAKTLHELGYTDVVSLAGGFSNWKQNGHEWKLPQTLTPQQQERYSRHTLIPEVGESGQLRLLDSKVLLIGAGGLGSPAALYLAAAGVGTIGFVDDDVVDASNLQRQIIHSTDRIGMPKVESAAIAISKLNPDVKVIQHKVRLDSDNVLDIIKDYDLIVDGVDNFPTRYLINDAALKLKKPVVDGSIYRFDGTVTTFLPFAGPCYRCFYPEPPPPDMAPSCQEAGVLGVLCGVIGSLQAVEAVKVLLGIGKTLAGRQLVFDALAMKFREFKRPHDPTCPVCGDGKKPEDIELIDYQQFCNVRV
jgi:sulfur-carrier protein adenylyltransferase/sulfurtransferase